MNHLELLRQAILRDQRIKDAQHAALVYRGNSYKSHKSNRDDQHGELKYRGIKHTV